MNDPLLYFHTEPDPQFRERKLTPVMSGQVRQLTGKMLIPSSRIRLMDTLGHGKIAVYLAWMQKTETIRSPMFGRFSYSLLSELWAFLFR